MKKEFEKSIREIKGLLRRGDIQRIAERAGCSQPLVTYVLNKATDPDKLTTMQLRAYATAKEVAKANQEETAKAICD